MQSAKTPDELIDKIVFTREKEQIPYWNKFLQGYYDASAISSDAFDQAVQVAGGGEVTITNSSAG